jgi:hypothetical protein
MAMDKPNAVRPAYSGGLQIHRVGPGRKLASFCTKAARRTAAPAVRAHFRACALAFVPHNRPSCPTPCLTAPPELGLFAHLPRPASGPRYPMFAHVWVCFAQSAPLIRSPKLGLFVRDRLQPRPGSAGQLGLFVYNRSRRRNQYLPAPAQPLSTPKLLFCTIALHDPHPPDPVPPGTAGKIGFVLHNPLLGSWSTAGNWVCFARIPAMSSPPVPEGRSTITHRFNGGDPGPVSPEPRRGERNVIPGPGRSFVPDGT